MIKGKFTVTHETCQLTVQIAMLISVLVNVTLIGLSFILQFLSITGEGTLTMVIL